MKKRSATDRSVVQKSADELSRPSAASLARLRSAQARPVDTSDLPETRPGGARARRDAAGRLPAPPKSPIREGILAELGRRKMTRYELWKRARAFSPTISESAVYEFLRGERQIGLAYIEALMAAVDLVVRPIGRPAAA